MKTLKLILSLLAIGLFFTCVSCTPHNYPDINSHSLIFERGNDSTYLFSDHRPDSLHWPDKVIPNGYQLNEGIKYDFWIVEDIVYVRAHHRIDQVKWFSEGGSKGVKVNPNGNNVFKHKFSNRPHSNGYFVVEMPWVE